jgi:hypothetical protein
MRSKQEKPEWLQYTSSEAEAPFLPSPELGEQLERLEQAQVEIDRKKAEVLARLRDLQDRDLIPSSLTGRYSLDRYFPSVVERQRRRRCH